MNGYLIAGCVLLLAGVALLTAVGITLADERAGKNPAQAGEVTPRGAASIMIGAAAAGALAGYLWPTGIGQWFRALGLPMP